MAKKPNPKTKKKVIPKKQIPQTILPKIKQIKSKFFKEETLDEVKKIYWQIFDEQKEKYKENNWNDNIIHKRSIANLKNKKKREKLGGTLDKYYGVMLGASKIRDLNNRKRGSIIKRWTEDPDEIMHEGLIMTNKETNPATGEIELIPILDTDGNIIPRDNREFFIMANGNQFKNNNYGNALARAYRRTIIGMCTNLQGIKGVCLFELRDSQTELEIPLNKLVKFSARTIGSSVFSMTENEFISNDLLEEMIGDLEDDIEQGYITKEYSKSLSQHYQKLIDNKPIETYLFSLRSSKGTYFSILEDLDEVEKYEFKNFNGGVDINLLFKEHMYPFSCDCCNVLDFHNKNRYIDGDPEKPNWDEFLTLQDVNVIQINTEASLSGNYTIHVEDESLSYDNVVHLDKDIDAIRILVPSHIKLDFGQDSKVNIVGSVFQFQARDSENNDMYEDEKDAEGNKIPVLDYPVVMAYGIYPIPQYKIEVETIDLTHDDEINVEELMESKEITKDEEKDMEEAVKKVKESETDEDLEEIDDEDLDEESKDGTELW